MASIIQPKSGNNHAIFGSRYVDKHNVVDPKWKPHEKVTQYECMATVYKKHHELSTVLERSKFNVKVDECKEKERKAEELRIRLNNLESGNVQSIKNVFKDHREQQLSSLNLPIGKIIQSMDCKIFDLRKGLDRMSNEKNRLSKRYRQNMMKIEDSKRKIKYEDVIELGDEIRGKRVRVELENSRTRWKAYDDLRKSSTKFIDTLAKDSQYFTVILTALNDDVSEQTSMVETIMKLGKPALVSSVELRKESNAMQARIEGENRGRLETIYEFRRNLMESSRQLQSLVQNQTQDEVPLDRYRRETASMLSIQKAYANVESDIKVLSYATACINPAGLRDAFAKAFYDGDQIQSTVEKTEGDLKMSEKAYANRVVLEDRIINNHTSADIERDLSITQLQEAIESEKQTQSDLELEIAAATRVKFRLQYSLQRLADLLKNVGSDQVKICKPYPTTALVLPLLDLESGTLNEEPEPPETIEENLDNLFDVITDRANLLMAQFNSSKRILDGNIETVEALYHTRTLDELNTENMQVSRGTETDFGDEFDPLVPQRNDMKAKSEKIVNENSKGVD